MSQIFINASLAFAVGCQKAIIKGNYLREIHTGRVERGERLERAVLERGRLLNSLLLGSGSGNGK